jgi:PAS domain S-box-containing protein
MSPTHIAVIASILALVVLALLVGLAWHQSRTTPEAGAPPEIDPRALAEATPIGILLLDRELRVLRCNAVWKDDHALGGEPIQGAPFGAVLPSLAAWEPHLRRCLDGAVHFAEEERVRRASGAELVFRWQASPWRQPDGTIAGIVVAAANVTDFAASREQLRHDRQRLESTLANMSDGYLRFAPVRDSAGQIVNFRFTDTNPAALRLLHLAPEQLIGRLTRDIFPFVDTLGIHQDALTVHRTGLPRRYDEVAIPGLDLLCNGTMWRVDDDLVMVFQDISEKRDVLQRLRDSRLRFEALSASASLGICITDALGVIVDANPTLCSTLGLTREEVLGSSAASRLSLPVRQAGNGCTPTEIHLRHSSGRDLPVLLTRAPLLDSQSRPSGEVLTFSDLTPLKLAAEALRVSQANYQTFISRTSEGIAELTFDIPVPLHGTIDEQVARLLSARPRCTILNPAAGRFLRIQNPSESIGRPIALQDIGRAVGADAFARLLADACRQRFILDDRIIESGHRAPDPAAFRLTVDGDLPSNRLARVAIVFSDVTEHILRQRAMQQTQKLESLGLMAGGIAHDFNNLLVGIMGQASLAELEIDSAHPARLRVREILSSAERATDLTRQLLAYSGRASFRFEPVSLSSVIEENRKLLETLTAKHCPVDFHLAESLPRINADRSQILQVAMNLIINAAEACEGRDGSVRVTTSTENVDDDFDTQHLVGGSVRPGPHVVLTVSDTGTGMDEALRARIFDPFFTTKFTGRGLGLSALLGIVRAHQGILLLNTVPDQGSTFRVLFPASSAPEEKPAVQAPSEPEAVMSGTILHIEDDAPVIEMMRLCLERIGCSQVAVRTSRELDTALSAPIPGLRAVFLDLIMPDLKPRDALARVRAAFPDVPVVVCTGYNEPQARAMVDFTEVAAFIGKPFRIERVAEVLRGLPAAATPS